MNLLGIVLAFLMGIICGAGVMIMVHTSRADKLERWQKEIDHCRMELDFEKHRLDHEWDCPKPSHYENGDENIHHKKIVITSAEKK